MAGVFKKKIVNTEIEPRSRIKELRHVRASELLENPKNWRRHPPSQVNALRGALERIGYADALIAREVDGRLMLIDGHLRAATTPDAIVPVLVVDLEEGEADFLLATLDPLAALASTDGELLKSLLDSIALEDVALQRMLDSTLKDAGISFASGIESGQPIYTDEEIIQAAFEYFRATGFPYRNLPLHTCMQELNDLATLSPDKQLRSVVAYQVCDTYHPHRFAAHGRKMLSPLQAFNDDKLMRRALSLAMKYGEHIPDVYFTELNIVAGTQSASNFRPGFAAAIYKSFARDDSVVLDTSTGYGGRLLGFAAACPKGRYIGIEPNTLTHESNLRMAKELRFDDRIELHCAAAEDVPHDALRDRCDFAFTSPPYFIKEVYSEEETQSSVRYKTAEAWRAGFLEPMLALQYAALKPSSLALVNVAAVKIDNTEHDLVAWTREAAEGAGFEYLRTEQYTLTHRVGVTDEVSVEPVLVFRKPG